MSNYELYESTSKSTKRYLDIVFSLLRYFDNNETNIDDNDILPISFFLAGLKTDDFVKQIFNSFGITFEKCFDVLKNKNIPFEERSALETSEFTTYKLEDIYRTILDELKNDYYLEDKDIKYEDIEPYQLFDYMMTFYYEKICALIKKSNGIDDFMDSTEFFEYTTYREDKFAEFAKKYGIDIYEQANTESIKEYHTENFNIIFDDGKLYLFSNEQTKLILNRFKE